MLRPGYRQWGYGTQAGCFPASHGLCWAHTHTHTHVNTHTPTCSHRDKGHVQSWMCLCLIAQKGMEALSGGQASRATISQPRDTHCPSEEPSAPPPPPSNSFNRKQMNITRQRSRAVLGAVRAAQGRASLARDHSMAELVSDPQQGLDLGRARPQPLLYQLLPGCTLPVPVHNMDS